MTFIESSLSTDEHIAGLYQLHWVNMLSVYWFILLMVLSLAVHQLGLLSFLDDLVAPHYASLAVYSVSGFFLLKGLVCWLTIKKTEMGATNKRVIKKTGIFTRTTEEMKISSIETVTLRQGVIGKILNYGNLFVTGQGVSDVALLTIKAPMAVKQSIESVDSSKTTKHDDS